MNWLLKILKWFSIGFAGLLVLTLVTGRIYQVVRESDDLAWYPAPGELVTVDGHVMHIHCIGQGSPSVIFELGVGSASASWGDVQQQVAQFTKACAYDRPGLGYSAPTDQPLRSANVAERLQKLLRAAKVEGEILLVGWSAGGVYVRDYYRRYPDDVKAMLFVDSSHEQQANRLPQTSGDGADPALKIAKHLAPFGLIRLSGILARRVDRGNGSDELKSRLKVVYHQSHTLDTVWRESEAFNLDINADRPPSSLGDLPLIVLAQDYSEMPRAERDARDRLQHELTQLSSNGEQVIASESGHHIYADRPDLVVESIEALVMRVREIQEIRTE